MSKRNDETIMIERQQLDVNIEALENLDLEHASLDAFTDLICSFHHTKGNGMRYITLAQVEQLRKTLPMILGEILPAMITQCEEPERKRILIEEQVPMFITSVVKLCRTRQRQSESGRGAFGRLTVAKLQERLDRANAEIVELRHGQVHVESTTEHNV